MVHRRLKVLGLAVAMALAACGENTPAEKMAAIEEMQAGKLAMTEEQQTRLSGFVEAGKAAMAAGNADAANNAFDGALAVLKAAEDAAVFNKAD